MPDHEPKRCPRCGNGFECRLGSIHRCQCVDIALSDEMRESIAHRYDDCLCRDCLMALSAEDTSGVPNRAGEVSARAEQFGIQRPEAGKPAAAGSAAQATFAGVMHVDDGTPVSARIRQRSQAAARARRVRPEDLIRIMQGPRR